MVPVESVTTISPDELAENLPDIMIRVRKHRERFVVQQDDDVIMRLEPPTRIGVTVDELIDRIGNLQAPGDGFGDDLEAIHASQGYAELPKWPDD